MWANLFQDTTMLHSCSKHYLLQSTRGNEKKNTKKDYLEKKSLFIDNIKLNNH